MTPVRAAGLVAGVAFGFLISGGQFTDPDRIRDMLLLEDEYLYVMMAAAVAVGTLGSRLLRRTGASTLLPHERVSWTNPNVASHHVVGAAVVGLGWAIADSCPAPFAGQLAQGVGWSLFTIAGVLLGVWLYLRRQDRSAVTTSG